MLSIATPVPRCAAGGRALPAARPPSPRRSGSPQRVRPAPGARTCQRGLDAHPGHGILPRICSAWSTARTRVLSHARLGGAEITRPCPSRGPLMIADFHGHRARSFGRGVTTSRRNAVERRDVAFPLDSSGGRATMMPGECALRMPDRSAAMTIAPGKLVVAVSPLVETAACRFGHARPAAATPLVGESERPGRPDGLGRPASPGAGRPCGGPAEPPAWPAVKPAPVRRDPDDSPPVTEPRVSGAPSAP